MSFASTPQRFNTINRRADITDPDDLFAWFGGDGLLRDLTGWTLSLEIIDPSTDEIEYTKTSGVVGGDGTGKSNLAVAWQTAEMAPLVGRTRWKGRIIAVQGSERAEFVLDSAGSLPVWVFSPVPTTPGP